VSKLTAQVSACRDPKRSPDRTSIRCTTVLAGTRTDRP
jgi:hypothetical protein